MQQLVDIAGRRGVRVSCRQITEWHRDGLLPRPERPSIPGKRGRGPLLFPEPAPDAVVWLGQWRRSVEGADRTKVWLWLEGYDYIGTDGARLRELAENFLAATWAAFQTSIPGLADLVEGRADEETEEVILDAVDQITVAPLEKAGRRTGLPEAAAVSAALVGINLAAEGQSVLAAMCALQSATDHGGPRLPDAHPEFMQLVDLKTIYDLFSLPGVIARGVDIEHIRLLWRGMAATIDVADAPGAAGTLVPPEIAPFLIFMRYVRHRLYALDPRLIIVGLAAVSAICPRDVAARYARNMLATRDVLNHLPAATTVESQSHDTDE